MSMQIKLTWQQTPDYLLFDVINPDIALWFVETSQQLGNKYSAASMSTDIPRQADNTERLVDEITRSLEQVNKFFSSMKLPILPKPDNWADQQQLNQLHKSWAETRLKWPKLDTMLYKIDPTLFDRYHEINCHIHLIEKSFHYDCRDSNNWRVPNPFKHHYYQWKKCHLSIIYPGHGRNAYEKFLNLDDNPDNFDIDNCNWDNIDGFINIELARPVELTPPAEFLSWCQQKNLVPNHDFIAIANLSNWRTTLIAARATFVKNLQMADNYFSLEIIE